MHRYTLTHSLRRAAGSAGPSAGRSKAPRGQPRSQKTPRWTYQLHFKWGREKGFVHQNSGSCITKERQGCQKRSLTVLGTRLLDCRGKLNCPAFFVLYNAEFARQKQMRSSTITPATVLLANPAHSPMLIALSMALRLVMSSSRRPTK